jgi:3-deoxy-D-arabino-heptulosonate 7-phosphate (DAHP) synthase
MSTKESISVRYVANGFHFFIGILNFRNGNVGNAIRSIKMPYKRGIFLGMILNTTFDKSWL